MLPDDVLVLASDLEEAAMRIRELENLLWRKTLEAEMLTTVLRHSKDTGLPMPDTTGDRGSDAQEHSRTIRYLVHRGGTGRPVNK
jgi:hypothetical protein